MNNKIGLKQKSWSVAVNPKVMSLASGVSLSWKLVYTIDLSCPLAQPLWNFCGRNPETCALNLSGVLRLNQLLSHHSKETWREGATKRLT